MDIQVGDRVTYKIREIVFTEIINNLSWGVKLKNDAMYEILKIERPKYEVVEEKKELLTEEEREFLKDICKYYDVSKIQLGISSLYFYTNTDYLIINVVIPEKLQFENIKRNKQYTLKELGLE